MQKKQRGSIIALTLIVLSFILTSGLAVITVASLERKSGLVTQKSVVAFQAADSGVERILKRMYIDNSPSIVSVPKNGTMTDATLNDLAQNLTNVEVGAVCNTTTDAIVATSNSTPAYTFQATFLDGSDTLIDCADATWRDKVVRIRVDGFYRQTVRVIELGVKPRPKCEETVDDADGNTYDIVEIADMCWTQQNMRVGNRINSSTAQSNNGTTEYYCYNNNPSNCTTNHPNYPDGGLYTWDETMQYVTTEGAQGICPAGWHIPTEGEWTIMVNYLDSTIGGALPLNSNVGTDIGTQLAPSGSSGFEFNLAGVRSPLDWFGRDGTGQIWTSTERDAASAYIITTSGGAAINKGAAVKGNYYASVRCILD
jgi:uncharacterized protein (TIGR02145 family)